MSRLRDIVGLMLVAAIGVMGCTATETQIRPPKPPEEFNSPPDDPRYTGPIQYPKETMEQDYLQKKSKDSSKTPGPMGSPRSGGMGGGGMGGRPGM